MMLNGKTIVVAGAAGRIGREIVAATLDAGAQVMAADHSQSALDALQEQFGREARLECHTSDITDASSVAGLLAATATRFGSLDGAVNTAYPRNANYGRHFLEVSHADFSENLGLHLGGYFIFMQQCVKFAVENRSAFSLVNLSSIYGVVAPRFEIYDGTAMTMPVEYAAIKSGLIHLTRYANAYAKGSLFRANCVSPGGILDEQDRGFLERYNAHCRSKGMLDAKDVAGAVNFLLSDTAEFILGQNIVVDDGFSI